MTDPPISNRREFLSGRAAAQALGHLADQSLPTVEPGQEGGTKPGTAVGDDASYLMQIGRNAMACEFQVFLNAGQHPYGPEAALRALDLVEALEAQMTVYRPHSEVSLLNQRAATAAVPVESRLFALFQSALQLSEKTGGAFDITSGPLSKVWGFYRRAGRFPGDEEIADALQRVGVRWLELESSQSTVKFLQPGVEINLGAIGKGYALDRCAELLVESNVTQFMIHGGQSSILARGSRSGGEGWRVALRHPLRPERRLAEFWLRDQALGTSGAGKQFFYHEGKRYGHVLDPRTGRPAEGVLSATVLAPTAAQADALSTAFFVLGPERAAEFCVSHPNIAALLVVPTERTGASKLVPINLPDESWLTTEP